MTRIFRLEVDGAVYWVAAETSEDAVIALRNDDAVEDKDMTPELIVPVSRADAETTTIDNGNGETISLWRAFCDDVSPRVIACSEWA